MMEDLEKTIETGNAEIGTNQFINQIICPIDCETRGKFYKCYQEDHKKCRGYQE